jgi:S1-C subfamily serine protease
MLSAFILCAAPAFAEPADIRASARSVVRVILVERNDEQVSFIGHGSGFAIAPNLIVTNAHVVAPTIENSEIIIGIVPSEGSKSYGGSVIAYSPRNDLALIRMNGGSLPSLAFYAPQVSDGSGVFAIGYPGAVDRALGLTIGDLVEPGSPVKTPGTISSGVSPREFDSLLHTAPMAQGNSGGPLVDNCGRIVGVNSFGTLSDGSDAEFAFAVSNKEILPFLRDAGVRPIIASTPCLSSSQISQAETQQALTQMASQSATQFQEAEQRRQREEAMARQVDQQLRAERENYLLMALLCGLIASFAGSATLLFYSQNSMIAMRIALGGTLLALIAGGAILYFRPSYDLYLERLSAKREIAQKVQPKGTSDSKYLGDNICTIDRQRSKMTVSNITQLELNWAANGCINGRTLYVEADKDWQRIFVPNNEQTISVNSFNPESGDFRISRYLVERDIMDTARKERQALGNIQCSSNNEARDRLSSLQSSLAAALPSSPNEILVFSCVQDSE